MPKVSIILPVYNKDEYLSATLNLLINQSYQDWELIVVDDGSTDDSSEIIESFALRDHRINIISQENRGVSAARNLGLSRATGEWIWFVDADDFPNKDFLTNVFSHYIDDEVGIIVGNYERLEKNSIINKIEIEESGYISAEQFPDIFMKYQYSTGFWGYLWNKLLNRKQLIKNNLKFQEGLTLAEDLKFMVALYRSNTILFCIPCFAMRYTVDSSNSSGEKKIDYLSQLEIQLEIKKWIIDYRGCNKNSDFFKKIISSYAAFVIFYGYEDNLDCVKLAKELVNNPNVELQLCTKDIESTMFPIVLCLKRKWFLVMNAYLFCRKTVRDIYRILKKG
ncbi:MAG: glycosyltransferase family 2 protein [Blautia sp.]